MASAAASASAGKALSPPGGRDPSASGTGGSTAASMEGVVMPEGTVAAEEMEKLDCGALER